MRITIIQQPLNIAVIGGGVAGITISYILQNKHRITRVEKNAYLRGHTNTILIPEGPDAGTAVDTGFIVLNDKTYPMLHKLLSRLDIQVRKSDMSFGFHCQKSGLQYSGANLSGLFAQRSNLVKPSFLKMLIEISRFCRLARKQLKEGLLDNRSLRQYIVDYNYSNYFVDNYLIPMGAAIWSTPAGEMLQFPAKTFLPQSRSAFIQRAPSLANCRGRESFLLKCITRTIQRRLATELPHSRRSSAGK